MTDQRSSRTVQIAVLALAVFIAGVAVGVIADRLSTPHPLIRAQFTAQLGVFDKLDLSPRQRVQLESITIRRAPRSREFMKEMSTHLQAVADSVDNELRSILTPQQQDRLDSLLKRAPEVRLRRKLITPGGTTIDDTVIRARRDSAKRP
jgi:Spy/CpxP family protein refolding chaperone